MLVATLTEDRHGVWSPSIFKLELERALTTALQRSRAAQTRNARRARREASRASAPAATVELHRLPPSPSMQLDGWYSAAPKAIGEQQDVTADEAEDELRQAANLAQRFDAETVKNVTGLEPEDGYDTVPMRTAAAIAEDDATLAYLHRDEAAAPRGFGMTDAEERRAWLMNARLRYRDALQAALTKHQGRIDPATANEFPALKGEAQFVRSVQARWGFLDELARHGVHNPERELVAKLRTALAPTYQLAAAELAERRLLAVAGRLDRYRYELTREPSSPDELLRAGGVDRAGSAD